MPVGRPEGDPQGRMAYKEPDPTHLEYGRAEDQFVYNTGPNCETIILSASRVLFCIFTLHHQGPWHHHPGGQPLGMRLKIVAKMVFFYSVLACSRQQLWRG